MWVGVGGLKFAETGIASWWPKFFLLKILSVDLIDTIYRPEISCMPLKIAHGS